MIKKWVLRLLILLVCIAAAFLFMVNMMSGTGDTQKKGLEGALSRIFSGNTQIGKLNTFNILPQFNIDLSNMQVNAQGGGHIFAEHLQIAFGFDDLLRGTRHIEIFKAKNVDVSKGVWADTPVTIDIVEMRKSTSPNAHSDEGQIALQGAIGTVPMKASLSMQYFADARPSFALRESNVFRIELGHIATTGNLVPYKSDFKAFTGLHLSGFGKDCTVKENKAATGDEFMKLVLMPQIKLNSAGDFVAYCSKLDTVLTVPQPIVAAK